MNPIDQTSVVVFETDDHELLTSCSLVLSAVNIQHAVITDIPPYSISVSLDEKERAIRNLRSYIEENKNWPPQKDIEEHHEVTSQPPTFLVIGALVLFYWVTGPWSEKSPWFAHGAGSADAILVSGEYFRLITALTLHADIVHLLGNCLFGGFLIHFFCKSVGTGIGLFAILFSATSGNYINVLFHGGSHNFVGFSTAVFSTIGMLSMMRYRINKKLTSYHVFAPLMAGVALLAMTGSAGERTDLGAHFFGLICGFATGYVLNSTIIEKFGRSSFLQTVFLILTSFLVYGSWQIALTPVY